MDLFQLRNRNGMEVHVASYGATVVRMLVPDAAGRFADVVLGLGGLDGYTDPGYLARGAYFGAVIGRCTNRIAGGRFLLNDRPYALALNRPPNHLHGGVTGFDKVVWAATARVLPAPALELKYLSRDGEEGYPGNLQATVTYTLGHENELQIEYLASTDRDTIVNLTNHSYFNLQGHGCGNIAEHEIEINAEHYTPIDELLIPTGISPVRGTPFDFLVPRAIGARLNGDDRQLRIANGYDHNFVLNGVDGRIRRAAMVREPSSGRTLELLTTEPGLQFYTGNFLNGDFIGKHGLPYGFRAGFCLETQRFPNAINEPAFPSTVLRAGESRYSRTIMRFGTEAPGAR